MTRVLLAVAWLSLASVVARSSHVWPTSSLTKRISLGDRCALIDEVFSPHAPDVLATYLASECAAKTHYAGRAIISPWVDGPSRPDGTGTIAYLFSAREKCEGHRFRVLDAELPDLRNHPKFALQMPITIVSRDELQFAIGVGVFPDAQTAPGSAGCAGVAVRGVLKNHKWKLLADSPSEEKPQPR